MTVLNVEMSSFRRMCDVIIYGLTERVFSRRMAKPGMELTNFRRHSIPQLENCSSIEQRRKRCGKKNSLDLIIFLYCQRYIFFVSLQPGLNGTRLI